VKTNLVHTLYRVQKYGLLPIERFNEMLRPSEFKRCGAQKGKKTWYSMPVEVFTSFVFRVRNYFKFSLCFGHSTASVPSLLLSFFHNLQVDLCSKKLPRLQMRRFEGTTRSR